MPRVSGQYGFWDWLSGRAAAEAIPDLRVDVRLPGISAGISGRNGGGGGGRRRGNSKGGVLSYLGVGGGSRNPATIGGYAVAGGLLLLARAITGLTRR